MKTYQLILIGLLTFMFIACGDQPANDSNAQTSEKTTGKKPQIEVKYDGKTVPFGEKSGTTANTLYNFTLSKNGKNIETKGISHFLYITNFEGNKEAILEPVKSAGQIRLQIQLVGEETDDKDAPLKVGSYPMNAPNSPDSSVFNRTHAIGIYYFDGEEKQKFFNISKTKGEVKINSVSGDTISGEIDADDGENSVKGKFTVKTEKE